MTVHIMTFDKMTVHKMTFFKMTIQMGVNKMTIQMAVNKMTVDRMTPLKMTMDKMIIGERL